MNGLGMRLARYAAGFLLASALQMALWIGSWVILGNAAPRLPRAACTAWAACLLASALARAAATWFQGQLAVEWGTALKQRLLAGALRLPLDELRREGPGRLLGRVLEAEAFEQLALSGGLAALLAAIELLFLAGVLAAQASDPLCRAQLLLLAVWMPVLGLALRHYATYRETWTRARLDLTHQLVEQMNGHRTRLAQPPEREWLAREAAQQEEYFHVSRHMDGRAAVIVSLGWRGWIVANIGYLALTGVTTLSGSALMGLGVALYVAFSLRRLIGGAWQLIAARIAWRELRPLRRAAVAPPPAATAPLSASGLAFQFPDVTRPLFSRVDLRVAPGDRVWLRGDAGEGKSTLAATLAGLRAPTQGELTTPRVALAAQFHDNHLLSAPLAFNLLLGRAWPPTAADLREAHEVCLELGLGPVIERMPQGLMQLVGETGWQLSHGERSRVFLARALLQPSDLVILDESFTALDPETFRQCWQCVERRARTVLVIEP
jgi:ATP-binding cassette subfamily B protein